MKYCKTCDGYGKVTVAYPVDEFQRAEPPDVDYCPDCDGIDRRNAECKVCFDSGITYKDGNYYCTCDAGIKAEYYDNLETGDDEIPF